VVEGGAGLAVIQDGALTVGFGGASGSLLNWGLEEGFVTGFGAGVVFPVGSCSVDRASRLGMSRPEAFFSRFRMNSLWSILACLSLPSGPRFSRWAVWTRFKGRLEAGSTATGVTAKGLWLY
jgi:hypothetical protein